MVPRHHGGGLALSQAMLSKALQWFIHTFWAALISVAFPKCLAGLLASETRWPETEEHEPISLTGPAPSHSGPASAPVTPCLQDVPTPPSSRWHTPSASLFLFIFTRWACQALSWHLCSQCLPATMACLSYLVHGTFLLNRMHWPDGRRKLAILLF